MVLLANKMISKAISQYKRSFLVGLFAASLGFAVEVETSLFNTINNTSLFLTQATGIGVDNNPNEAASPCLNLQLNCEQVTRTTADENDSISSNLPVVLTIDQTEFDSQLFGISPIDRCYMAEKIKLIAPDAKLLFIDYDVSPLVNPNPEYTQCQNSLDQVLDHFGEKLVLIEPLVNQNNQLKHQWKNTRQANGVTFAAANLNKQFGFVVEQSSLSNSVARTVYRKAIEENELSEPSLIDFNHLSIDELKTTSLKNRVVFLGGTYGFEDRHTSPWGSGTHGIHLQALDYASYLYPVTTGGQGEWKVNLIDYGLDLAIAFIVLLIMGSIWTGYHKWRMPTQGGCKNELAFVFVIIAVVVFGVLAMLAAILTGWILIEHQIWIEPIPIMLGIFIDGIINREPIESSNTDEKPACREDSCLHLCWCLIKSLPGSLWRLFKSLFTLPQKLWSWLIESLSWLKSIASKLWHPIETFISLVEPFKDLHRIKQFKIVFMALIIIYYPVGYTLFGELL